MAFQLSPGVNVTEIDLTTVVPAVATSDGAIGGVFRWGPVGERVLVDSENQLVARFAKPSNLNAETYFTAANFLSYANRLYVSRAANTSGATPHKTARLNKYVANLSSNNSGSANYDNTDVIIIVSQHGANGTGTLTTNSVGGITTVSVSTPGFGMNVSPTLVFKAANGAASNGTGANVSAGVATSHVQYVVDGGTLNLNSNMYITQSSNTSAVSYGESVTVVNSAIITLPTSSSYYDDIDLYFGNEETSYTAVALETGGIVANLVNQIVKNDNAYTAMDGNFDSDILYVSKYPGALGNSLKIAVCDSSDAYTSTINSTANFTYDIGEKMATAIFAGVANTDADDVANEISIGDQILVGNSAIGIQYMKVSSVEIVSNTNTTLTLNFEDPYRLHTAYVSNTVNRYWEFFNVVESSPGQTDWVLRHGNTSANDELHLVVVDDGGQFTGTPGTILEVYKGLSRATDAKNADTSGNYYKDVINQNSNYIWWANDRSGASSANSMLIASSSNMTPFDTEFAMGSDGLDETSVSLSTLGPAYDLFVSPEDVDISLILQGHPIGGSSSYDGITVQNFQLANYIIDNICESRKDCVALISPDKNTVLNNFGNEALTLKAWRSAIRSSSYAVLDSGYKYQYDRYNDIYRWIPLNGDIGGLCVRTDNTNDAWWSPAGFNRGQIKNIVKLAWNPRKSERDVLYVNGVNPVVTFPGQGTILYGDKTLLSKPSAFDRINVRRLFIVLEKAISVAAKASLFEFNDQFTRSQFKNLVTPYLRQIQGRRGITDFKVVCDDSNNTAQIVDTNQFVGDIYIKPARSINFIQLNFVAVGSGVQFSEVVGKF
jgi:hypothetical protein